jgi:ADP-heptose:LPS heptosyltransferase
MTYLKNQFKKSVKTLKKPKVIQSIAVNKKPSKAFRISQHHDKSMLLDLTYSSGQLYSLLPTPTWFTYSQKADISVICPLYMNTLDDLVDSWDFSHDGLRVEFIFVDDNCPWQTGSKVAKLLEQRKNEAPKGMGRIYVGSATQGYGACCNFGAEVATGKILLFLHPESKLFPGSITSMAKAVLQKNVGAVGGLHVNEQEDSVIESGLEWSWENNSFLQIGSKIYKGKKLQKPFQMNNVPLDIFQSGDRQVVSSNFMAVNRADFQELGGFSSTLFHQNWSDADFCCMLKEKGRKVLYQQSARSYHKPFRPLDKFEKHGEVMFFNKWIRSGRIDSLIDSPRLEKLPEINSILIRRQMAHGDVLVAAAVAPALKKKYPKAKIVFSTDCPEVVEGNPWIDQIINDYSERQFNLFFNLDMAYEYRPSTNFLESYADAVGVQSKDCQLFLKTEATNHQLPEKFVVMHAGNTFWAGRGWSTIKFDQISNRLRSEGHKIVCVGTLSDHKPVCTDLDLRGMTNIAQLADIIKHSYFFIGTDSFPMMVAETFGVKGVAFFGSIIPETRLINKSITAVVASNLDCIGCHHRKALPCVATTTCERGVQECVTGVSVERMWGEIKKQLELSTIISK